MADIHSLIFDWSIVEGWHKADDTDRGQGWLDHPKQVTKTLMLDFFPENQSVPSKEILNRLDEVRQDRKEKANAEGMCLLEHEVITTKSGLQAIRVIEKKPMAPHGMAYNGSLTMLDIPFYRVQVWCFEVGPTGLRDSVILNEFMAQGTLNPELEDWGGWWIDPHNFGKQTPLMQNVAENAKYDSKFPNHPLSQVREYLRRIEDSLQFDPTRQPPPAASGKGTWLGKLFGKN